MEKLKLIFDEYYGELKNNVTWPTATDLQGNTVVVLIASLLIAIVIALIDFAFNGALQAVYQLFQ